MTPLKTSSVVSLNKTNSNIFDMARSGRQASSKASKPTATIQPRNTKAYEENWQWVHCRDWPRPSPGRSVGWSWIQCRWYNQTSGQHDLVWNFASRCSHRFKYEYPAACPRRSYMIGWIRNGKPHEISDGKLSRAFSPYLYPTAFVSLFHHWDKRLGPWNSSKTIECSQCCNTSAQHS